jgi:NADH-quinone oxidoreductase subunit D
MSPEDVKTQDAINEQMKKTPELATDDSPEFHTEEFVVNMGPQHPSTHGVLRLELVMDGERVVSVKPHIGYLHRGMEKTAEFRTYPQYLPMLDRVDYVSAIMNELSFCLAVEKLLGIEIPLRAEYLRTMSAEIMRIASHLIWLGVNAMDLGALTPFLYTFREREKALDLLEMLSGQRMTCNYLRIGGVAADLPAGFLPLAREFCQVFPRRVEEYERILTYNEIFMGRMVSIGQLKLEDAIGYGVSGPNLRACGLAYDLRKVEPYSAYDKVRFDIPTGKNGDSWDRFVVRVEELRQSVRIITQCLDWLEKNPGGDIKNPQVKAVVKPPEGEAYGRIESSRGIYGTYIRSDGSTKPYRLKLRGASFSNLSVFPRLAKGLLLADLVAVFCSLDIILPDCDR